MIFFVGIGSHDYFNPPFFYDDDLYGIFGTISVSPPPFGAILPAGVPSDWVAFGAFITALIDPQILAGVATLLAQQGASAPPPPTCEIDLYTQPAGFSTDPFIHTFLAVSVTVGGYTTTTDLEAGPSNGYGGFLNNLNDQPATTVGSSPAQATNTYPTPATDFYTWGSSSTLCAQATSLLELSISYPNNKYGYSKPYNSNSFTYTLLTDAGVSIPWWVNLNFLRPPVWPLPLPRAPGWGFLIPSWLQP